MIELRNNLLKVIYDEMSKGALASDPFIQPGMISEEVLKIARRSGADYMPLTGKAMIR